MTTMWLADSRAATRPPLPFRSISFMMQLLSSLFYARRKLLDSRNGPQSTGAHRVRQTLYLTRNFHASWGAKYR
jgi:hypothetical protein